VLQPNDSKNISMTYSTLANMNLTAWKTKRHTVGFDREKYNSLKLLFWKVVITISAKAIVNFKIIEPFRKLLFRDERKLYCFWQKVFTYDAELLFGQSPPMEHLNLNSEKIVFNPNLG